MLPPSCRTEILGVESGIWLQPNADFVPIFSEDRFLTIKAYAFIGQERGVKLIGSSEHQPDRQSGVVADVFEDLQIDIRAARGTLFADVEHIVEATLDNLPLSARSTIHNDHYTAVIEYPIKTINVGRREHFYQTDTGPVMLPDLNREWDEMIEGIELAYAASNSPTGSSSSCASRPRPPG